MAAQKPTPKTAYDPADHVCFADGCAAFGSFGRAGHWWCRDHVPPDFWDFRKDAHFVLTSSAKPRLDDPGLGLPLMTGRK